VDLELVKFFLKKEEEKKGKSYVMLMVAIGCTA
jgi:hypothetical protein